MLSNRPAAAPLAVLPTPVDGPLPPIGRSLAALVGAALVWPLRPEAPGRGRDSGGHERIEGRQ